MKKTIPAFILALLLVLLGGFVTETTAGEAVTAAAPVVSNPKLQEYMKAYDAFMDEYFEALKTTKARVQELAAKRQALEVNLSADDSKKLQEYSSKQTKLLQQAIHEFTPTLAALSPSPPLPPVPPIPTTGSPELQEYLKAYGAFIDEYIEAAKAAKAGDPSKLQALAPKAQEFNTKSQTVTPKLSADDAKQLQDYSVKQAQRLQAAMQ